MEISLVIHADTPYGSKELFLDHDEDVDGDDMDKKLDDMIDKMKPQLRKFWKEKWENKLS